MAWRARVAAKSPDYQAGEVTVMVEFYDEGDPATVLHARQFRFQAGQPPVELAAAVREVGAEERRKRAQVDALAAQITVGAVIGGF